jgi:hypothetical protein
MKKLSFALFLGIALLMMVPNASAQSCAPAGEGGMAGPTVQWYNYTENGYPDTANVDQYGNINCWDPFNAFAGSGLMPCGFFGERYSAFEFDYGGEISQQFTIPATSPHTNFAYYGFSYFLNLENPNHEYPWDLQLNIQVWDQTTGRVLISDHYDASQPDVACGRRDLTGFNGNLAGHTILVRIMGTRGYSSSHIRVRLITFYGQ